MLEFSQIEMLNIFLDRNVDLNYKIEDCEQINHK